MEKNQGLFFLHLTEFIFEEIKKGLLIEFVDPLRFDSWKRPVNKASTDSAPSLLLVRSSCTYSNLMFLKNILLIVQWFLVYEKKRISYGVFFFR